MIKSDTHTLYTLVFVEGRKVLFFGFNHVSKSRSFIDQLKKGVDI